MKITTRLLAVALGLLSVFVLPATAISTSTSNVQKEGGGPVPPWQAAHNTILFLREGGGPVPPWQLLAGLHS